MRRAVISCAVAAQELGPIGLLERDVFLHAAVVGRARIVPRAFVVVDAERVREPPGRPRRDGYQGDAPSSQPPREPARQPRRLFGVPFSGVPVPRSW